MSISILGDLMTSFFLETRSARPNKLMMVLIWVTLSIMIAGGTYTHKPNTITLFTRPSNQTELMLSIHDHKLRPVMATLDRA